MEIEISKQKKKKGGRFFFFLLSILCVGLCVVVAQFFASVITTGSIGFSFSTSSQTKFKLYAVTVGTFTSKTQAEESAISYRAKNAGGYVYELDNKFYVVASIYESKNDAESVVNNLSSPSFSPEIIELQYETASFAKISSNNLKKTFSEFLENYKNLYLKLYDISVSLDTSVYTITKSRIEIDALKEDFNKKLEKLTNGSSSDDGIYYLTIKNYSEKIVSLLSELVEYNETDNYPFSAKIKNVYIKILDVFNDLNSDLNEI